MRKWLTEHGIAWERSDVKSHLLMKKIKESNPRKAYATDAIAETNRRVVLRTPVAHCELNPIELVWSKVKGYLRVNNTTLACRLGITCTCSFSFGLARDVETFLHTRYQRKRKILGKDGLLEDAIDEFLIELNVDDNDEEDEISDDEELDHEDRFLMSADNEE